jgi:NADPH-dependent ferric siderophore reductase
MDSSPPRRSAPPRRTTVVEKSVLTPSLVRIVVEGEDLAGFRVGEFTDHYVKCFFGEKTRSYTVRAFDPDLRRLTLDFVVHGDAGLAGPWAAEAQVGDELLLRGPGGAYAPSSDADWHLMVGDEAVIPAIAVSLERVRAGVPVFVVLEVDGPDHELTLTTPGELHLTWLHRQRGPGMEPDLQLDAVRELQLPAGEGQAFVHGEAEAVLRVRRHLLRERGFTPDRLSATGYWKQRHTDEEWRAAKREWIAQAEQDLVAGG